MRIYSTSIILAFILLPLIASAEDSTLLKVADKFTFSTESLDQSDDKWQPVTDEFNILSVTPSSIEFSLFVNGANLHTCELTGIAQRRDKFFEFTDMEEPQCVLHIYHNNTEISLEDVGFHCHNYYCGARAGLDGAHFYRKALSK